MCVNDDEKIYGDQENEAGDYNTDTGRERQKKYIFTVYNVCP